MRIIHNAIHAANASMYIQNKRNEMNKSNTELKIEIRDTLYNLIEGHINSWIEDMDSNEFREELSDMLDNRGIIEDEHYTFNRSGDHPSWNIMYLDELVSELADYYSGRINIIKQ
jgi:translation initiation factor IF-2